VSPSGNHFLPGSNWVDCVPIPREIVALRSDGTLWCSEKLEVHWDGRAPPPVEAPPRLVRLGEETNWQSVVAEEYRSSVLLLKQDGTLWRWGTNQFEPRGLRAVAPYRLGTEADWARLLQANYPWTFAWKKDGRAWVFRSGARYPKSSQIELEPGTLIERMSAFDNFHWRSMAWGAFCLMGLREDGTLWVSRRRLGGTGTFDGDYTGLAQVGAETNWVSLAGNLKALVALKADGSLWKWPINLHYRDPLGPAARPPVRLSRHSDWLAAGDSVVSLAADGSLWFWWGPEWYDSQPLLAPSRRPDKIATVLEGLSEP
jgi:hypothetical protein